MAWALPNKVGTDETAPHITAFVMSFDVLNVRFISYGEKLKKMLETPGAVKSSLHKTL